MAVSPKAKIRINVLAFLVIGLVLIYAMATQVLTILQDRYSVFAVFPDAGGVFTDQEVTYRGVQVGEVGEMRVVEQGVEIELLIREEVRIPREGTEARVGFRSAVGEQFVDILPSSGGPPFFEDGGKIPIENTQIPVSTQELLTTLQNVLAGVPPEDLEGAVDALGIGLTGRGPDLATIIESLADISEVFAERAPEVEGILQKGTAVGDAFLRSRDDFVRAIAELVTVSESLASSTGDLQGLMEGTNLTSDELVALIRRNRAAINKFIEEFAEVNALQAEHKNDLELILGNLPDALGGVVKTFEPKTGLVRFGLINDQDNTACSYGTERRPPSDRSPQRPPRNARCEGERADGSSATSSQPLYERLAQAYRAQNKAATGEADITSLLSGAGGAGERSSLPARMDEWSWILLYLNQ